jgi:insertion element IS1 protein InsB
MARGGNGIRDTADPAKHLTLRTRIKRLTRKTICFSKSIQMHDIVIGLFVNRYEFGLRV